MYHFFPNFDLNYLLRELILYRSLVATGCDFILNVLALDKKIGNILAQLKLPNIKTIPLATLKA